MLHDDKLWGSLIKSCSSWTHDMTLIELLQLVSMTYRTTLHFTTHSFYCSILATFKLAMLIFRSLHGLAPQYLADDLIHVADMSSRHRLRSVRTHRLEVPRVQPSATEHSVRPVPDSGTACPVTSSIVRLSTHSVVGWNISFLVCLFLDISIVFCVYFIFLWTLKFFYLGHVKKSLHNTIQYTRSTLAP